MALSDKIANYTNSTASENVTDALKKGVDYTISVVASASPNKLVEFSRTTDDIVNGNPLDWADTYNAGHLLSVIRDGNICREISHRLRNDAGDSSSIYYALANDPVYFQQPDGKIDIVPAPTEGTPAELVIVPHAGGYTINDSNETIQITNTSINFPAKYTELVIMHAAECILMERMYDFRTSIPSGLDSEWSDALAKAKKLFDDSANIGGDEAGTGLSVQYWLNDEDEDMAATTIQAISTELGRADRYQTKFRADIEKLSLDYQWTASQIQMLGQKKQEFIQINIGPMNMAGVEEEV